MDFERFTGYIAKKSQIALLISEKRCHRFGAIILNMKQDQCNLG